MMMAFKKIRLPESKRSEQYLRSELRSITITMYCPNSDMIYRMYASRLDNLVDENK